MQISELTKILNEEAGLSFCEVCGIPFKPRNSRQKTCGSEECKRKYHSRYVGEQSKKKREENPEDVRRYGRTMMRKYRQNQKTAEALDDMEEYWRKREEINKRVTGIDYGKRQAERTLASIPKIDVNIGGKNE